MRIDKWLWAARFYKTRSLAAEAVERERVRINGRAVKPARDLHIGDQIQMRQAGGWARTVVVLELSTLRGPAPVAQTLYHETAESVAERERAAEQRRLAPEPATSQADGRPTKRDRRDLDRAAGGWQRWSASLDDR